MYAMLRQYQISLTVNWDDVTAESFHLVVTVTLARITLTYYRRLNANSEITSDDEQYE